MTVRELIEELKQLPPDYPVCVQDGMDPSDPTIATLVEVKDDKRPLTVWSPYIYIS